MNEMLQDFRAQVVAASSPRESLKVKLPSLAKPTSRSSRRFVAAS